MYHSHLDFWSFQYSLNVCIMTFLSSVYGIPDLTYHISSFPNFLNPKESMKRLHITSRPNLALTPFKAACCPLSPWNTAILCPPSLSILGPSWPMVGGRTLAWVTECLGHWVWIYCFGTAGLLIFKWLLIPRWQEEHTRKHQIEQMVHIMKQENYTGQLYGPLGRRGRPGRQASSAFQWHSLPPLSVSQITRDPVPSVMHF